MANGIPAHRAVGVRASRPAVHGEAIHGEDIYSQFSDAHASIIAGIPPPVPE